MRFLNQLVLGLALCAAMSATQTAALPDVFSNLASSVSDTASSVADTVGTAVSDAASSVSDTAGSVMDTVTSTVGNVVDKVGAHPWESIQDVVDSKNDTETLWQLIQTAGLEDFLDNGTYVATVFAPLDEAIQEMMDNLTTIVTDKDMLTKIISYHVIPGAALTLADLTDGMILQSLIPGSEGQIRVDFAEGAKKPKLVTSSGQRVPLYQYDIQAGEAIVHTIKGVLLPGTHHVDHHGAKPPSAAPADGSVATDVTDETDVDGGVADGATDADVDGADAGGVIAEPGSA